MMGRQDRDQRQLFYEFSLDEMIPADHLLRRINVFATTALADLHERPSSAWTAKANKRVQFGYGLNYLIDVEHAIIVDVEPTPARTYDEVASTRTMLERTEQRLDLKPDWLAADTAYGTGKLLAWLLGKNITPHIPVWERYPSPDGMYSRSNFTYDAERDVYVCPNGRLLRTSGTVHDGRVRNYLSQPQDCRACTLKQLRAPGHGDQ
jgi:hypothetical protein